MIINRFSDGIYMRNGGKNQRVESKTTPKLDAVGERDISLLSIRKEWK